jgi:hypothetical protein
MSAALEGVFARRWRRARPEHLANPIRRIDSVVAVDVLIAWAERSKSIRSRSAQHPHATSGVAAIDRTMARVAAAHTRGGEAESCKASTQHIR